MTKYPGVVISDLAAAAIIVGTWIYADRFGGILIGILLLISIILASIIHGVVTQKHYRSIIMPHIVFSCAFFLASMALQWTGVFKEIHEVGFGLYLELYCFVLSLSLIPALITKLIMYLVEKRKAKSQPTTDTTE